MSGQRIHLLGTQVDPSTKVSCSSGFVQIPVAGLQTDHERFGVHKCILMAHSPHYHKLFTDTRSVKAVTGVAYEEKLPTALFDVLIYCYFGGFIPQAEELAIPMFQLADKYSMDGLKNRLEEPPTSIITMWWK